jgi:NAD(P)-dependent dehydrogenase (short-subunit alcohol dehydrogenase family)
VTEATARGLGRLRGKSAVVTGAAKGIGKATAELFAREETRLVITDVDEAGLSRLREQLAGAGAEVEAVVGDVSVVEDARRMISTAVESFGRIDVLVANAGIIPLNTIVEATPEDWDRVMAVDGRGMFLTCKFAVEAMLEQEEPGGVHSLPVLDLGSRRTGPAVHLRARQVRRVRDNQAPRGRVGRKRHPSQRSSARHHSDRGRR